MTKMRDFRFSWKARVRAAQGLPRSAKHLAFYLVDEHIFAGQTTCWPSNKLIAANLNLSVRSVQRNLDILELGGWIKRGKAKRIKRAIKILLPARVQDDIKRDIEQDIRWDTKVTKTASENATNVTPYKKHEKKHSTLPAKSIPQYVCVSESEFGPIRAWKSWIAENTEISWDEFGAKTFKDGAYNLPCRYPDRDEQANSLAREFVMVRFSGRLNGTRPLEA